MDREKGRGKEKEDRERERGSEREKHQRALVAKQSFYSKPGLCPAVAR